MLILQLKTIIISTRDRYRPLPVSLENVTQVTSKSEPTVVLETHDMQSLQTDLLHSELPADLQSSWCEIAE